MKPFPIRDLHDLLRILKDLLQPDVDRGKAHITVHSGKLSLLVIEFSLHLRQTLFDRDHILDCFGLFHHLQKTLLLDLQGLLRGVVRRVLHADIPCVDGCIRHLTVIFQILHERIEFLRRYPGRNIQIPARPASSRPVTVIPVRILIIGILRLDKTAKTVDFFVDALR